MGKFNPFSILLPLLLSSSPLGAVESVEGGNLPVAPRAAAPPVSHVPSLDRNYLSGDLVGLIYPYYNQPYPNSPKDKIDLNGKTAYRPNHGIAHAVRSAALGRDVVELFTKNDRGEMTTWLRAKLASDPDFLKKLTIANLAYRAGRQDESSTYNNALKIEGKENGSLAAFEAVAKKAGLKMSATDLENFKLGMELEGNKGPNPDADHISRLLRVTHLLDLARLKWDTNSRMKEKIPELADADLAQLNQRARGYLAATGDLRFSGEGFTSDFVDLSTNPGKLATTVEKLSLTTLGP